MPSSSIVVLSASSAASATFCQTGAPYEGVHGFSQSAYAGRDIIPGLCAGPPVSACAVDTAAVSLVQNLLVKWILRRSNQRPWGGCRAAGVGGGPREARTPVLIGQGCPGRDPPDQCPRERSQRPGRDPPSVPGRDPSAQGEMGNRGTLDPNPHTLINAICIRGDHRAIRTGAPKRAL